MDELWYINYIIHYLPTGPGSYVEAASTGLPEVERLIYPEAMSVLRKGDQSELCPYAAATGMCRFGDRCQYLHGDMCDLCHKAVLHPVDQIQREQHQKVCLCGFNTYLCLQTSECCPIDILYTYTHKYTLMLKVFLRCSFQSVSLL